MLTFKFYIEYAKLSNERVFRISASHDFYCLPCDTHVRENVSILSINHFVGAQKSLTKRKSSLQIKFVVRRSFNVLYEELQNIKCFKFYAVLFCNLPIFSFVLYNYKKLQCKTCQMFFYATIIAIQ